MKTTEQKTEEKELKELANRAAVFFNDVLPQLGGICLQDYSNMNELGMLISKHADEEYAKTETKRF